MIEASELVANIETYRYSSEAEAAAAAKTLKRAATYANSPSLCALAHAAFADAPPSEAPLRRCGFRARRQCVS